MIEILLKFGSCHLFTQSYEYKSKTKISKFLTIPDPLYTEQICHYTLLLFLWWSRAEKSILPSSESQHELSIIIHSQHSICQSNSPTNRKSISQSLTLADLEDSAPNNNTRDAKTTFFILTNNINRWHLYSSIFCPSCWLWPKQSSLSFFELGTAQLHLFLFIST